MEIRKLPLRRLTMILLALLCLQSPLFAEELTVHDGTKENRYIPFYGVFTDTEGSRSQCLFPASDLTIMQGSTITRLTFYCNQTDAAVSGTQSFSLMSTSVSSLLTEFLNTDTATVVYAGNLTISGGQLILDLTTPFYYAGGNLLLEWECTAAGNWQTLCFYGTTAPDGAGRHDLGSFDTAGSSDAFLPKTTFTFTPSEAPTCASPASAPAISDLGPTGATVSWAPSPSASTYEYTVVPEGSDIDWTTAQQTNDTVAHLSNLSQNTRYTFYVRTYCSADDRSHARTAVFRTDCSHISLPWEETFDSRSTGTLNIGCWTNEHTAGSDTARFRVVAGYGSNATHVLCLPLMGSGNYVQLTTPPIDIPAGEHTLSIDMWRDHRDCYILEGIRIFAGEAEIGFIPRYSGITGSDHVPAESSAGWYTYYFSIPESGTQHITLQGECRLGWHMYLDNLRILSPACLPVDSIRAPEERITDTSATVVWQPSAGATQYGVVITDGADTLAHALTTVNEYTLAGLVSDTTYTLSVSVTAINSAGESVPARADLSIHTRCAAVTYFPWAEDFEGMSHTTKAEEIPCYSSYPLAGNPEKWQIQTWDNNTYLKVSSAYYGNGQVSVAVVELPEMRFERGRTYRLEYDLFGGSTTAWGDTTRIMVGDSVLRTVTGPQLGGNLLHFTDSFPGSDAAARIRLEYHSLDGSYDTWYAGGAYVAIDNIRIEQGALQLTYYTLTLTVNDAAMGTVSEGGTFAEGTLLTLTATPAEGYEFVRWSDGSTDNPRLLTLTEDTALEALFREIPNAVGNVETAPAAEKFIQDGRLLIRRGGQLYDALGRKVSR